MLGNVFPADEIVGGNRLRMNKIIKFIANPIAGGDSRKEISQAQEYFRSQGYSVDVTLTTARGDAERAAREAREGAYERVIAAGGDGTLNEVVNGLTPSEIPLAFIPLGTTNVFALEVGIPFTVEEACDIALHGQVDAVCIGQAGEKAFLLMAGVGFDAEAVYRVSSGLKRYTGKFAYVVSALSALFRPSYPLLVELEDGRSLQAYNAIISNARFYGGRFSITPLASLKEDRLDVCLFKKPGRWRLLRYAATVAAGRPLNCDEVEMLQCRGLSIGGANMPVQIDGDYLGRLPMSFRVLSGQLRMVLPATAGSRP